MEDIMEILRITVKGSMMNTLERFHINEKKGLIIKSTINAQ
jgi:hypothetical protein